MKKFLIIIPMLALIIAGCGKPAAPQAESFSGSIDELLSRNKSAKCDLTAKAGEDIVSGTTYISNKKARSDYQIKGADEKVLNSHYIIDGEWMYSWTDNAPDQSFKIKLDTLNSDELKSSEAQKEAKDSGAENYSENMDYQCYNWTADNSKFAIPADIKFTDFDEMMNQLKQYSPSGQTNSNFCAQCEQLDDAQSKASCKQSLGCK